MAYLPVLTPQNEEFTDEALPGIGCKVGLLTVTKLEPVDIC